MCTIMTVRETLEAELMLSSTANKLVAELMEYDFQLAQLFTGEELKTLCRNKNVPPDELRKVLNEAEQQMLDKILSESELDRENIDEIPNVKSIRTANLGMFGSTNDLSLQDRRLCWKSVFVEAPFCHRRTCGKVMVWLDGACYGNGKKGFYYVRYQEEFTTSFRTTAYNPPKLIVDSRKLRGAQKLYMERKCRETMPPKDDENSIVY